MPNTKKHFTFVLLRDTGHPIRQIHLRGWQLSSLLAGVLTFLAVLLVLSALGLSHSGDRLRLRQTEAENQRLKAEMQVVEGRVDELEGSLREVDEFQRWTRNLANLEPLGEEVLSAQVGGPGGHRLSSEMVGMDRRLMRLGSQSQILRQSAEEVLESVRDDRESLGRIPSIRPIISGRLTSRFGRRVDPFTGQASFHEGIDLSARRGTPIVATADGRVKQVEYSSGGYGNTLVIDHGNGYETRFAHCDRILVTQGQKVSRNEMIATVGSSGHSTAPHVHYEVHKDGTPFNPSQYIISGEFVVD